MYLEVLGKGSSPRRSTAMADTKLQDATSVVRGRITARVPQHVESLLQTAAEIAGSTLNQFVVQAALVAAEKVIEHERIIRLSGENAKWFCDLIDNPPPPKPALVDAFKRINARKVASAGPDSTFEFGT